MQIYANLYVGITRFESARSDCFLCVKPYKQKMPVRDRQFLTHNNQTYEGFDYEKVHENTYFPFLEQT